MFADPQHPYTLGLMSSVPRLEGARTRLATIPGTVPPPQAFPKGCRFSGRCPFADRRCREEVPPARQLAPNHHVACFKAPLEQLGGAAA